MAYKEYERSVTFSLLAKLSCNPNDMLDYRLREVDYRLREVLLKGYRMQIPFNLAANLYEASRVKFLRIEIPCDCVVIEGY